jgi:hypothetical protein
MTRERFTELPSVSSAQMTDIICAVQGYTSPSELGLSVKETLQDVYNLFQSNVILFNIGNPNGALAGRPYQLCWDTLNKILYVCTVAGSELTAVWNKSISLIGRNGITIDQNGDSIIIAGTQTGVSWVKVNSDTVMQSGYGYQIDTGSNINLTLPVSSTFGDEIYIKGFGGGLWKIVQTAGQQVIVGASPSTMGVLGSVSATNQYDTISLSCSADNTIWQALGAPQGRLSFE